MVDHNFRITGWRYKDPQFTRTFEFELFRTEPDRDNGNQIYWTLFAKMVDGTSYFDPLSWENGAIDVARRHCETAITSLNVAANGEPSIGGTFLEYSGSFPEDKLKEVITRVSLIQGVSRQDLSK
jgi:hypothetical protein